MSLPPTTPNKSGAGATQPTESINSFAIDSLGFKQNSLPEPSPASTYGETAAGDSVPATPQDRGDNGEYTPVISFLLVLQVLSFASLRIASQYDRNQNVFVPSLCVSSAKS